MRGGIRIISDGTPQGTRVLDAKGDQINGITKIEISPILPNGLISAVLHFVGVELDVDASHSGHVDADQQSRLQERTERSSMLRARFPDRMDKERGAPA